MDEGVDPTRMCQSLVDKVARSKQLQAVTNPEVLVLFEEWLEELEQETLELLKKHNLRQPAKLAEKLGISVTGAAFLLGKLEQAGLL